MATTPKKPSREKEETREGDMMFDVHPLHPSRPSPSQKLNRENRIKNACLSNSHSNIAASNDKRPLFVQIPATSSASLVSTSLPIQCLRLSNFFFFRGIFADNFLPNLFEYVREVVGIRSEPIGIRWGGGRNRFRTYSNHLRTYSRAFSSRPFPPPLRPIRHRKHMTPIHTRILRLLCIR